MASASVNRWRQRSLRCARNDGSTNYVDYTPGTGDGVWQPTYPAYMPAENPQWATLTPFIMTSDSQFRPAGPPALNSAQWVSDYNQVKSLGAVNSTTRTADQTQIALFWNDPTGTATPPGHWNLIANQLAASKNLTLADTTKMLAELNVAMGDAAIVAWDAKYTTNFWRPITAIPAGGGNSSLTADPNWRPLLTTPPFPEYISGHSTFSSAAAAVLDAVFGPNTPFTIGTTSPGVTGITRSFTGFDQAAQEAAHEPHLRRHSLQYFGSGRIHGRHGAGKVCPRQIRRQQRHHGSDGHVRKRARPIVQDPIPRSPAW